jgi:hypothetical protein
VFSCLHAIVQISLQIKAFTVNVEAASFLKSIASQGDTTSDSLIILSGSSLYMCGQVPLDLSLNGGGCNVVWNGTKGINVIGTQIEAAPRVPSTSSTSTYPVTSTSSAVRLEETFSPSTLRQTATISASPTSTSVNSPVDDDDGGDDDGDDDDGGGDDDDGDDDGGVQVRSYPAQ